MAARARARAMTRGRAARRARVAERGRAIEREARAKGAGVAGWRKERSTLETWRWIDVRWPWG